MRWRTQYRPVLLGKYNLVDLVLFYSREDSTTTEN